MGLREQKPLVEEVGDEDVVEDEAEGVEDVGVGEDEHSNYSQLLVTIRRVSILLPYLDNSNAPSLSQQVWHPLQQLHLPLLHQLEPPPHFHRWLHYFH